MYKIDKQQGPTAEETTQNCVITYNGKESIKEYILIHSCN